MGDSDRGLFNGEFLDNWYIYFHRLEALCKRRQAPAGELDGELARWADTQRRIRHMLPAELESKLSALDFDFDGLGSSWESRYRALARFVGENGHACLPADQRHEVLRDWLKRQILNRRLLSESQTRKLDRLGVDWDLAISRDHRWELMFWRLKGFHKAFGHCRVPQRWARDKQLANWVTVQRRIHAQNKLREDRHRRVSALGFDWDMRAQFDSQWEGHFQELVSFHQAHGHCRVPGKHRELVSWIERQRLARKNNLMPADRERLLDGIGFVWSFEGIKAESWEGRYRQLLAYKQKNGHSFVPVNCRENKALGTWVASQRGLEARGRLSPAKKRKLSELGFVWAGDTQGRLRAGYDAQWEANFEKLKVYRQVHGSCQVSLKTNPALQQWTRWQRQMFFQGRIPADRISRLNEIRFPWSVEEGYWMRMYEALANFRAQFGHTRVPYRWAPNPQLAAWVYRVKSTRPGLPPQKIELLNGIGFDWALSKRSVKPWGEMYRRLVAFKQGHGHTRIPSRWPEDPKLGKWASRMRHEKDTLGPERVSLLEAVWFDWGRQPAPEEWLTVKTVAL